MISPNMASDSAKEGINQIQKIRNANLLERQIRNQAVFIQL